MNDCVNTNWCWKWQFTANVLLHWRLRHVLCICTLRFNYCGCEQITCRKYEFSDVEPIGHGSCLLSNGVGFSMDQWVMDVVGALHWPLCFVIQSLCNIYWYAHLASIERWYERILFVICVCVWRFMVVQRGRRVESSAKIPCRRWPITRSWQWITSRYSTTVNMSASICRGLQMCCIAYLWHNLWFFSAAAAVCEPTIALCTCRFASVSVCNDAFACIFRSLSQKTFMRLLLSLSTDGIIRCLLCQFLVKFCRLSGK